MGSQVVKVMLACFLVSTIGGCLSVIPVDSGIKTNKNGDPLHWKKTPITVVYDPSLGDNATSALISAVEQINGLVGHDIFGLPVVWPYGPIPDHRIDGMLMVKKGYGEREGGVTGSCTNEYIPDSMEMVGSEIELPLPDYTPIIVSYTVILHELGHSLGLLHDHAPKSIMHSHTYSASLRNKQFTAGDIEILRTIYHPKYKKTE